MPIAIVQLEPSNARLGGLFGLEQAAQVAKAAVNPQVVIAVGSALLGSLVSWLATDGWSVGEYNYWMATANNTFAEWDKLGWSSGCWTKDPEARKKWLAFWKRFSEHYKTHGQIATYSYVSDSEEEPARDLLKKLAEWGDWFDKNCRNNTSASTAPGASNTMTKPPEEPTDWTAIAKWGGIAVGGLVLLSVINTIRGAVQR
jgi:hypothetical protein